jgi:Fic family protein
MAMIWNWQQRDWPRFKWDRERLSVAESRFLKDGGVLIGTASHLGEADKDRLQVEAMSAEALTTSRIEGETLNRSSVQASVQRHLGLRPGGAKATPAEDGITQMMVELWRGYALPLSNRTLFGWHERIARGRRDLKDVGRYRRDPEPMQVLSGAIGAEKVYFEAPPAARVSDEMKGFIAWFNETAPGDRRRKVLPALTRAGIAHLYFESIHPFEDGNGRIGRAVAEKAIAQNLGQPVLISLATVILEHRRAYYDALERANKQNEITEWLEWFAGIAIEAQQWTIAQVEFLIAKTKLLDKLKGDINARQQKALLRMLEEGPKGFEGGMSAGKYSTITEAPSATATRDLADLVAKGALVRRGELRHTRYELNLSPVVGE